MYFLWFISFTMPLLSDGWWMIGETHFRDDLILIIIVTHEGGSLKITVVVTTMI